MRPKSLPPNYVYNKMRTYVKNYFKYKYIEYILNKFWYPFSIKYRLSIHFDFDYLF